MRRPVRLFAICLALVGQFVGAFGLPAARGSSGTPDAACGCCPADRTAGRCCCHHDPEPADDGIPPCCRAKKGHTAGVEWVVPSLRSKCQGPADTVPESVVPASVPPAAPTAWSADADETGTVPASRLTATVRTTIPDVPPPRR
jgi:hypothetical protein